MYKNFSCFKVTDKKNDKEPDYRLTMKVEDEFIEIGAGWIKTSPKGTKYISFSLSKPYKDRKGWHFVADEEDVEFNNMM